ncbi:MAG: ATP-binding protein [Candidatus Spechtbacterales bacterium]|nr:ATP-binding protein [Candidatus Spechtbacterales bacterium]
MEDVSIVEAKQRKFLFNTQLNFEPVEREDIIGISHILDELDQYIEYLKHFKEAEKFNVELNSGVVFTGQPGTGKTLCARYIATRSGAHFVDVQKFLNLRGDDVDLAGSHFSTLFKLAREFVAERKHPIVLFFDEFESFLENKDIVKQLKQELSGLEGKSKGVFVIATTNNPIRIDPALLRDGRIGDKIHFSPPNRKAKKQLLEYYAMKGKNYADDIDFESLSFLIDAGSVPSTIEEITNKAWRIACMRAIAKGTEPILTQEILLETFLDDIQGVPDNTILSEEELRSFAVYEVGRALVARTLGLPTQLVALAKVGYEDAFRIEDFDSAPYFNIDFFPRRIAVFLAGNAALKVFELEHNTSGLNDFHNASEFATFFVENFRAVNKNKKGTQSAFNGLSYKGLMKGREDAEVPGAYGLSGVVGQKQLQDIQDLLDESEERAAVILRYYRNSGIVDNLVKDLFEKEYLLQKDIDEYVKPEKDILDEAEKEKKNEIDIIYSGPYL